MRVVITGAAGFIGSRFAEVLLENAERLDFDDIVLLDALTYSGRRENMDEVLRDSRVSFIEGSITDADLTTEVLCSAHAVVHLAAEDVYKRQPWSRPSVASSSSRPTRSRRSTDTRSPVVRLSRAPSTIESCVRTVGTGA